MFYLNLKTGQLVNSVGLPANAPVPHFVSGQEQRVTIKVFTPCGDVPDHFFDAEFTLTGSTTFNSVLPCFRSDGIADAASNTITFTVDTYTEEYLKDVLTPGTAMFCELTRTADSDPERVALFTATADPAVKKPAAPPAIADKYANVNQVLAGKYFVAANGDLAQGTIPTVIPKVAENTFTVAAGFLDQSHTLIVPEADAPTVNDNVVTVYKGYQPAEQQLTIPEAAAPEVADNVVTIYKGYNAADQQLTVAEAAAPTVSDNIVTVYKGYHSTEQTVTVAEAAAPAVNDNVVTVYKGYQPAEQQLTISEADAPTVNDNVVTVYKGYQPAEQQLTISEANAPTVDASSITIYKGYNKTEQTINVNIPESPAETVTDNAVTIYPGLISTQRTATVAEAAAPTVSDNVVTVYKGYNKTKQSITVATAAAPVVEDNTVTIYKGYNASAQTFTIPEAAVPTVSNNIVTIYKGYQASRQDVPVGTALAAQTYTPTAAAQTITAGKYLTGAQTIKGDANFVAENIAEGVTIWGVTGTHRGGREISYGYINSAGKFQEVDLTGDAPVDIGTAIAIDAVTFNTGREVPGYSGGSMEFYRCASVEQPKVPVGFTVNHPDTDWGSAYKDEYLPVDSNRTGANRLWVRKNDLPYINDEYASFEAVGYDGSKWLIGTTYGVNEHPSEAECTAISNCTNANATMTEIAAATWDWSVSGGGAYSDRFTITEEWGAATGWSGYKCDYDAESGELTQAATLTTELTCDGFSPRVGKIYSPDSKLQTALFSDPAGVGFYQCTAGASVPSKIIVTGAGNAEFNGEYSRMPDEFGYDITSTDLLGIWYMPGTGSSDHKAVVIRKNYPYSLNICKGYVSNDRFGQQSTPYQTTKQGNSISEILEIASDPNNWRAETDAKPAPTVEFVQASGTWKGYKLSQNSDCTWSKADSETDSLTVGGEEPKIGTIYNEDATVTISGALGLEN